MREAKFATKTTPTPLGAYLSKSRLLGNRSLPQTTDANNSASSGDLLPPSPPAEQATASQDQLANSRYPPNIYHPQIPSVPQIPSATLNLLLTEGGDTGGERVVHERIKEHKKCGEP